MACFVILYQFAFLSKFPKKNLPITSFLYRRSQIQKAAVKVWPGNQFPNFRMAENKNKLDELAESRKEECSIAEIKVNYDLVRLFCQKLKFSIYLN